MKEFIYGTLQLPLINLEAILQAYVSNLYNILLSYFLQLDYKLIVDLIVTISEKNEKAIECWFFLFGFSRNILSNVCFASIG